MTILHAPPNHVEPPPLVSVPRPGVRRLQCLRVKDVAAQLGVSERHIRDEIAAGNLPALRIGRSVRVLVDDLDAYVTQLRTDAAEAQAAALAAAPRVAPAPIRPAGPARPSLPEGALPDTWPTKPTKEVR